MHNKFSVFESSPNHPFSLGLWKKIVFHETGPWGQKRWGALSEDWKWVDKIYIPEGQDLQGHLVLHFFQEHPKEVASIY